MELLFLFSLHIFLIVCYFIRIEAKKSRLTYGHLLFALFLPFIGELCLFAVDLGKSPADNAFVKPFKNFDIKKKQLPIRYVEISNEEEISRELLFEIIKKNPDNLTTILKTALNASDNEVVHIAAAMIMKLQRTYENKVKMASDKYAEMPNNMSRLKQYIMIIGEYYEQGLLTGESATMLLKQQAVLLDKYLNILPEDKEMGICLVRNNLCQEKFALALEKAEYLRYSHISDITLWALSVEICEKSGAKETLQEIIEDANKLSSHWSFENKQYWAEIQKGLQV